MRARLVAWMFIVVALAGCTGGNGGNGSPSTDNADDLPGSGDDGQELPIIPPLLDAQELTWYFTSNNGLSLEEQAAGQTVLQGGYSSFTGLVVGGVQFSDFQTAPFDHHALLMPEDIQLDLFIHTAGPALMDPAFSYAIWVGTTQSMPISFITATPQFAAPDSTLEVSFTIPWGDRLPLLIEPGEGLRIILAANYHPSSDADLVHLYVGGDTASRASITTRNYTIDPLADAGSPETETFTGTLHNVQPVNCANMEGVDHAFHPFSVLDDAVYLRVDTSGQAPGAPDLDMDVFDGNTLLGGGHTATAEEGVFFAGPAMDEIRGKDLRLRVSACMAPSIDYTVTVEQAPLDVPTVQLNAEEV